MVHHFSWLIFCLSGIIFSSYNYKHISKRFFSFPLASFCPAWRERPRSLRRDFQELVKTLPLIIIIIIITRPKPAYGRHGLAGSWGQDTDEVNTFLVFLTSHFSLHGFSRFPGGFSLSLMVPVWLNPSWAPQAWSETFRTPKRYSLYLYLGPTIPLGLAGRRPALA